jgi:rfaE bifunctional protein nucleotidyltransferase chain/domain
MSETTKIFSLDILAGICSALRADGKSIVHCHGVFDLLHIGHIKHFKAAKQLGDYLVVTITADEYVKKGPGRPAFNHALRAEALEALQAVDAIAINYSKNAIAALSAVRPNLYVKGSDYLNRIPTIGSSLQAEIELVRSYGGNIAYTSEPQFSSSELINRFFSPHPPQVQEQLERLRQDISEKKIEDFFKRLLISEFTVDCPNKNVMTLIRNLCPNATIQNNLTNNISICFLGENSHETSLLQCREWPSIDTIKSLPALIVKSDEAVMVVSSSSESAQAPLFGSNNLRSSEHELMMKAALLLCLVTDASTAMSAFFVAIVGSLDFLAKTDTILSAAELKKLMVSMIK